MPRKTSIKSTVRKIAFMIPGTEKLWSRWINGKSSVHSFIGWGMTTNTLPPWNDPADALAKDFLEVHNEVVDAVTNGKFNLSQFQTTKDKKTLLEGLMWRHYVVFWSARYAKMSTGQNIVEAGVCDGLTAYFALRALGKPYKAWLYDAWEGMAENRLLETERRYVGDYAYLQVDETKKNLSRFDTVFVKGFIPDTFKTTKTPGDIAWIHIDLNSSLPTTDSLKEFYAKMPSGGVILFDDYAGRGFTETKIAIDSFFADKKGILLHMPTGQAMFFKK